MEKTKLIFIIFVMATVVCVLVVSFSSDLLTFEPNYAVLNANVSVSSESSGANGHSSSFHPALKNGCAVLDLQKRFSTLPPFSGLPSVLVYACGKHGSPAFSTSKSVGGFTPPVTPTFAAPSGWTLSVGLAKPKAECSLGDSVITLKSGSAVTLRSGTNYVYCLRSSAAKNFSTLSITWSQ